MRTSAGASMPRRTWLPRTSRTRTVIPSPIRITSPTFRVSMSIVGVLPVSRSASRLGSDRDQELARDRIQVGLVAPAGDGVPEDQELCGPRRIRGRVVDPSEEARGGTGDRDLHRIGCRARQGTATPASHAMDADPLARDRGLETVLLADLHD